MPALLSTTKKHADLLKLHLTMKKNSIQQQIFDAEMEYFTRIKKPTPPTEEAIKKAAFVDKTYVWTDK